MMAQTWTFDQLAKLRHYRPDLVDQTLSEILARQSELQWLLVTGAYLDGEVSLGKAAELLGLHRLELQHRFLMQGIPLRLGSETPEEARAEADAIMNWNRSAEKKTLP